MAGVNRAIVVGNLGSDPEVRTTQQGVKVVTLSVATSESWRDKGSGERKERTDWHRVVIWGSHDGDGLAGVAEKHLKKGSKVYLEGKMKTRRYTDKQGVERYTTEVVLQGFGSDLQLLDRSESGSRPPPPDDPDAYGTTRSRPESGAMDDDIPF